MRYANRPLSRGYNLEPEIGVPKIDWRSVLALLTAGLIVSTGRPIAAPSIGSAVASASANIAEDLTASAGGAPHLGFDTFAYPGDDAMRAWLTADKYRWVGYYLPAPCHNDDSWEGKRNTLSSMGWGMAVIYVGQQTWGRTPGQKYTVTRYIKKRVKQTVRSRRGKRVRYVTRRVPIRVLVTPRASPGASCSSQLVSAARGVKDANDAIARTAAEGFAKGTVIFLDIERMDFVPKAMREYYKAWTERVVEDRRFRPGYYAHSYNANLVYRDVKQVLADDGISTDPPFWIASTQGFATDKLPGEVGHAFAQVWQGVLDVVETHNGVKLPIDVNVAQLPSPSEDFRAGE